MQDKKRWQLVQRTRALTGENQTVFSHRMGVDPTTLDDWEHERKPVGAEYVPKLQKLHDQWTDQVGTIPDPDPGAKNFLLLDQVGTAWVVASRHECAADAFGRMEGDSYTNMGIETKIVWVPEEIPLKRRLKDLGLRRLGAFEVCRENDTYTYEDI